MHITKWFPLAFFLAAGPWLQTRCQELRKFEFSESLMGTQFRLVIYSESEARAASAAQQAFQRAHSLNAIFSDYESSSEAMQLSEPGKIGRPVAISPEMAKVLDYAIQMSKMTKGAFDITIGPLSKLWRRAFRRNEFPEAGKIAEARGRVGYRRLKLNSRKQTLRIKKAGTKLDFGGIAKGFAIDEIARSLRSSLAGDHFLVDGGGDIYAGAAPPDEPGWKIALPSGKPLILSNEAIAVSGDRYRYLEWENRRYSHIIDPRTGLGTTHRTTIGVRARTCMIADAWASTLIVLGQSKSRRLLHKHRNNIQAYFFQNESAL